MQGYGLVNQCTKGGYHISQQKKKVLLGNVTCRGTDISFGQSVPEWGAQVRFPVPDQY